MAEYKKIESGKAELTVTLEGDNWQEAKKKAYKKVASKIEIKGFRKDRTRGSGHQQFIWYGLYGKTGHKSS